MVRVLPRRIFFLSISKGLDQRDRESNLRYTGQERYSPTVALCLRGMPYLVTIRKMVQGNHESTSTYFDVEMACIELSSMTTRLET